MEKKQKPTQVQTNPPLRFRDEKGTEYPSWEIKKLGDVGEIKASGDLNKSLFSSIKTNIYQYPVYSNSLDNSGLYGYYSAYENEPNTITITARGNIGFAIFRDNYYIGIGRLIIISKLIKINAYFLTELINHLVKFKNEITSIPQLTSIEVKKIQIPMPCMDEQMKIGNFLKSIDDKITIQVKKLEELRNYKKGLMQQLFPKANQTNPPLRFRDEKGKEYPSWETKKLGDVLLYPKNIKPKNIDRDKLITVRLHLKGVVKNENTGNLSLGSSYYIRHKGQFIYGKQNFHNGAFGIVPDSCDGYLSSSDIPSFNIATNKIDNSYLINYIGRYSFYSHYKDIASGTGSKRLHEKELLSINIPMPCMEEQRKIGNFLKSIDDKITIQTKKLEELKKYKQGLMQQLFPKN